MPDPTPLADAMSDNVALRHIAALTELLVKELNRDYLGIYGNNSVTVSSTLTTLRAADTTSRMVIVINRGTTAFDVFEEGIEVANLKSGEKWVSALTGKGAITAKTASGSSIASVATYVSAAAAEPVEEVPTPEPEEAPESTIVYPTVSGAGGLEAISTIGVSNRLYWVLENGITRGWRLTEGELENDLVAGIWRPLDYAVNNQKNFFREI
jgi:hypothetical protein